VGRLSLNKIVHHPMIRFSQTDLDRITTVLGLIAGFSTVLGAQGIIPQQYAASIAGVATALLGYLVQHPADKI